MGSDIAALRAIFEGPSAAARHSTDFTLDSISWGTVDVFSS
jgi:hypothetical protein